MKNGMLYVHALSPLHAGTGQSLDVIDLPIARERSTDLPYVPGSSVKGVLRAEAEGNSNWSLAPADVFSLFGPDTKNAAEHAGAVIFGDARLLLFPVRSVNELFVWVTSPYLVRRYLRDEVELGITPTISLESLRSDLDVSGDKALVSDAKLLSGKKLFIDDGDLEAEASKVVLGLAQELAARFMPSEWHSTLEGRLAVVSDSQLGFLTRQATEVTARIKIDSTKGTVETGGLWYEEALPAETLLCARIACGDSRRSSVSATSADHYRALSQIGSAQLGGKATVGRGLCRLSWHSAEEG